MENSANSSYQKSLIPLIFITIFLVLFILIFYRIITKYFQNRITVPTLPGCLPGCTAKGECPFGNMCYQALGDQPKCCGYDFQCQECKLRYQNLKKSSGK